MLIYEASISSYSCLKKSPLSKWANTRMKYERKLADMLQFVKVWSSVEPEKTRFLPVV